MQSKDVLKKHAELVDKMATALGVDLEEQTMRGDLSFDDISDAVLRCTACTDPESCAVKLARQAIDGDAPEYCRNKDLLEGMQGKGTAD